MSRAINAKHCKSICNRFGIVKCMGSPYRLGYKYCCRCEYYFMQDSMYCPCCGQRLRSIARRNSRSYRWTPTIKRYAIALIPTAFIVCSSLYNTIFI